MINKKIWMTQEEKDLLTRYAHENYTGLSDVVRKKVATYSGGGLDAIKLPRMLVTGGRVQLSFMIDEDIWAAALSQAKADGAPLTSIIRSSLLTDAS